MIRLIDSSPNFLPMYFLEKLCRICIQTGAPLVDIDTVDFDLVRLSEKLEVCANLVISKDRLSSEICEKCVNKLRVSYHFLDMCKKSTNTIQGYLTKLTKREENSENASNLEIGELHVEIEKLPELKIETVDYDDVINHSTVQRESLSLSKSSCLKKRQRITKEQRCSLLKQLLNKPKKERDKTIYNYNIYDYEKGGLKNIIDFTKNYEFSFNLDKNSNIESTPLDKLTAFSTNYFQRDFSEFKTHILHVIENQHKFKYGSHFSSDDEDYLTDSEIEDTDKELGFEEVMVEPDIKREMMDCEEEESQCPLDYLETSYEEEEIKVKTEECQSDSENDSNSHKFHTSYNISSFYSNTRISSQKSHSNGNDLSTISVDLSLNSSPAVKLLDRLVANYPIGSRKIFSPNNVRCRTRDQPYINPLLKNQFLYRSFKCERCNRYFKSQGYLKAHTSKVH